MRMAEHSVIAEFGQQVVRITLNRPQKRNPLDWSTVRQLVDIVKRVEDDAVAQVVVVSGAGKNFSAGGDLKDYVDLYRRPDDFQAFLEDFHRLLELIEASRKIYVAVVEGYCVAGGLELLLACDVVIAATSAKIGDAHVNFGQLPGAGGSQRLPRTVGPMRARYLMLTGEIVDATEAERIGLVSKLVPDVQLEGFTKQFLERLSSLSPQGLAGMKYLANQGLRKDLTTGLRMELEYVHRYATNSADATEGLMAFQEKRKPRFQGH